MKWKHRPECTKYEYYCADPDYPDPICDCADTICDCECPGDSNDDPRGTSQGQETLASNT